ncbi:MAG: glutamyl-tRNA reductase [Rhodospirillales bacterium]|nr:glutamyl-tRNA reductase [Rhodospirillales bacterium]
MAGGSHTGRRPLVVGANHRSSGLALRDSLFLEDPQVPDFLSRLKAAGIDEAMVLSTCDRVEVQAAHDDHRKAKAAILEAFAEIAGLPAEEISQETYAHSDGEAVRHAFAVAASLDSQVLGESQVLGQVKASHRLARDAGMSGSGLEALVQAAFSAAKRVRTETAIGERPVTIAAAAVQIAKDLHGSLEACKGVLIGVGDMGELVAGEMINGGLGELTVLHPTERRAKALARSLDCHAADYETLSSLLGQADVVVSALGQRHYALNADMVMAALRARRRKPVYLVDAGLPGDVDPAVNRLDGAFLYDLNDLEHVALQGRANREAESKEAWRIIDAEVAAFLHGRAEREAVPALSRLRAHFQDIRDQVLSDAGDDAERATRLLVNRLLHGPSRAMREIAGRSSHDDDRSGPPAADDLAEAERLLNRLFGVDELSMEDGKNPSDKDDGKG